MSTIQIRNVPEETSRELKARAAREGPSLSDYLLRDLIRTASRPGRAEVYARIRNRGRNELPPAAEVLAQERESRS